MNNNLVIKSTGFKDNLALYSRRILEKSEDMVDEIGKYFFDKEKEYLVIVCLTGQGLPSQVYVTELAQCKENENLAKDILCRISLSGAGAFTVLHNRAGNTATLKPSAIDEKLTDYFVQLSSASKIPLLDHIVIGNNNGTLVHFSYREKRKKKLSSFGKTFQEMLGDFRIDEKLFPKMTPVKTGWERNTVFSCINNKEEMEAFFTGGEQNV